MGVGVGREQSTVSLRSSYSLLLLLKVAWLKPSTVPARMTAKVSLLRYTIAAGGVEDGGGGEGESGGGEGAGEGGEGGAGVRVAMEASSALQ